MISVLVVQTVSLLLASLLVPERFQAVQQSTWLDVHFNAVVVDGHNDIMMRVMKGESMEKRSESGQSDLIRFREGGLDAQVFSIWVPPEYHQRKQAWKYATAEIDSLDNIVKRNPTLIQKVTNQREFRSAISHGKIAALIGIEGGHAIEESRENLIALYKRGVRSFGLTWNISTSWASSSKDEFEGTSRKGLTEYGKSLVRLCDSLGMLLDISHLGEHSIIDLLAITRNPVIASHSSCQALLKHHRNLSDNQLRAVAQNGGIVMVNFYPSFLKDKLPKNSLQMTSTYQRRLNELSKTSGRSVNTLLSVREKIISEAQRRGLATIHDAVKHIEHVIRVAGIDHVGLGSDFDGIDHAPVGLGSVTELPYLTRELLRKGYSPGDVKKVLGGNFLRVFGQVCP